MIGVAGGTIITVTYKIRCTNIRRRRHITKRIITFSAAIYSLLHSVSGPYGIGLEVFHLSVVTLLEHGGDSGWFPGENMLVCTTLLRCIHYLRVLEQVLFFVFPPPQATVQGVQEEWEDHSPFIVGL